MGSHGYGAIERLVLGSIADQVARRAAAPTMIVHDGGRNSTVEHIERLVVPLDGSVLAERALPVAATLADDLGVPIHLVRVVDFDLVRAAVQAGIPAAEASLRSQQTELRRAEQYLAALIQELRERELAVTAEVLRGSPATKLLDAIQSDDLVVMTTHGLGGVRRWVLGSVAEQLANAASAPVLLVRAAVPQPLRSAVPGESSFGTTP
jgi:nucleotide-binding universal stress UspA family protein